MKNIKKYFNEIQEGIKNGRALGCAIHNIRMGRECNDNDDDCPFCEIKSLEWLNEEEKQ